MAKKAKSEKSEEPVISKLSDKKDEEFIPTGITEVDEIIGGGVHRGRITEVWGQEGVGKTNFVTQMLANVSKDHKVLYVDTEFALNKDHVRALGADPDNIGYIADSRLERVAEMLIEAVGKYDLIILDSLAYLTPLTVDTNTVGENSIGLFARLIKHWVVKFRPRLGVSNTAFVAINQYRAPIGLYVKAEPPGGKSWLHAVDVRLHLTSNSADKITVGGQVVGHWVHCKVVKSKVSTPHVETKYKLTY
jgi:recombination protein RecA